MQLTMRAYQSEEDYWRIREFLREVFLLNGRRELCWQAARLDYWRWHVIENCNACDPVEDVTFIWETPEGQMAAVLHPEGRGEAHLHVHPGLRAPELEEEMLTVAEQRLARWLGRLASACRLGRWARYASSRDSDPPWLHPTRMVGASVAAGIGRAHPRCARRAGVHRALAG